MSSGFVKVYREISDSSAFETFIEKGAFIHMLLMAAWKPRRVRYKGKEISLDRGELCVSQRDFARMSGGVMSDTTVMRFWKRLEKRGTIRSRREAGTTVITICNYDQYQSQCDYGEAAGEAVVEADAKHYRSTEQEGKNFKKKDISPPVCPPLIPAEPKQKKPDAPAKPSPKRKHQLPDDFDLTPEMIAAAERHGINGAVRDVFEHFCAHHRSKGTTMLRWDLAWITWLKNQKRFGHGPPIQKRGPRSKFEEMRELCRMMENENVGVSDKVPDDVSFDFPFLSRKNA